MSRLLTLLLFYKAGYENSVSKEKQIGQTTIHELCSVSQINRTTFYKYYGSQGELLNDTKEAGRIVGEREKMLC